MSLTALEPCYVRDTPGPVGTGVSNIWCIILKMIHSIFVKPAFDKRISANKGSSSVYQSFNCDKYSHLYSPLAFTPVLCKPIRYVLGMSMNALYITVTQTFKNIVRSEVTLKTSNTRNTPCFV